jgi:antitoxin component YwqK of YwqJK toxin-antitoxin module
MKQVCILFFLLLIVVSCSSTDIVYNKFEFKNDNGFIVYQGKLFSGNLVVFKGVNKKIVPYKGGLKNGVEKLYSANGDVLKSDLYKLGQLVAKKLSYQPKS